MKLTESKLRKLVERKIGEIFSEGDVSREKRMQYMDQDAPEPAGEPDLEPEPLEGPPALIKQAKEIHASLTQNANASATRQQDIALNRVLVRRDLRDLGELLDELEAHLTGGGSELEARGHDDFSSSKESFIAP
jgi:hypothetical protein